MVFSKYKSKTPHFLLQGDVKQSELIGKPNLNPNYCSMPIEKVFFLHIFAQTFDRIFSLFETLLSPFPSRRLQRIIGVSLPVYYTGRSQCYRMPLLENAVFFVFLFVARVTFHCGIVGSGLRNLAKTCSRLLLGPILHNVNQNDFRA